MYEYSILLQLIQNQVKSRIKTYHTLQQDYPRHLVIDRKASLVVPAIIKMASASTSSEVSDDGQKMKEEELGNEDNEQNDMEKEKDDMSEGMKELDMNESTEDIEPQELDEGSEDDLEFLQYQSKWARVDQSWNRLNAKMDEFLAGKDPWEKMADLYSELSELKEDIEDRQQGNARRGEEIFRLSRNPGPLTEAYKVCTCT